MLNSNCSQLADRKFRVPQQRKLYGLPGHAHTGKTPSKTYECLVATLYCSCIYYTNLQQSINVAIHVLYKLALTLEVWHLIMLWQSMMAMA